MINLYGCDRDLIGQAIATLTERRFHADQIFHWMYGRQATSFRRTPSSSAVTITTPTSNQSRDTRSGTAAARGSAHSERRALVITQAA